jgi:hypothetical protein
MQLPTAGGASLNKTELEFSAFSQNMKFWSITQVNDNDFFHDFWRFAP